MAARGSGGFPVPRVLEPLYGLVGLAFQLGGAALLVALGYLAWGLFSGGLANSIALPQAERFQVAKNVIYASKILVAGGIACIISAASAGVATPPAAKLTTGNRPSAAVSFIRS